MNHHHRVLIIDDEEGIQVILEELLVMEGYDVRSVHHGQEGLDVLATWRPEVIVLDLKMPVMDGPTFRAAQRRLDDGLDAIPIILLSGSRDVADQAGALEAAATIVKPFDLDDVLVAVERTVQEATITTHQHA